MSWILNFTGLPFLFALFRVENFFTEVHQIYRTAKNSWEINVIWYHTFLSECWFADSVQWDCNCWLRVIHGQNVPIFWRSDKYVTKRTQPGVVWRTEKISGYWFPQIFILILQQYLIWPIFILIFMKYPSSSQEIAIKSKSLAITVCQKFMSTLTSPYRAWLLLLLKMNAI